MLLGCQLHGQTTEKRLEVVLKKLYDAADNRTIRCPMLFKKNATAPLLPNMGATMLKKYILDFYRGSEVLNDLSVMLTHRAMDAGGKTVDKFLLPLEMDADFRIAQLRAAEPLNATERQARERDLAQALFYANEVLSTDTGNGLTRTNISTILILKNKLLEAQKNSLPLLKSPRYRQEGQLLNAIIDALNGQKDKAKQAFSDLILSKNTRIKLWATYNRSVLLGEKQLLQ